MLDTLKWLSVRDPIFYLAMIFLLKIIYSETRPTLTNFLSIIMTFTHSLIVFINDLPEYIKLPVILTNNVFLLLPK